VRPHAQHLDGLLYWQHFAHQTVLHVDAFQAKITNLNFNFKIARMIPRAAAPTLERLAKGFPVVALTGPRHSGKTTLAKSVFKDKTYVSLENPDEREFALKDPKRFLQRFTNGAILDEVQRCPELILNPAVTRSSRADLADTKAAGGG